MKIKYVKSNSKFRMLSGREVDELINSAILKPIENSGKKHEKQVFNNWDLPVEQRPFRKCKKNDPL